MGNKYHITDREGYEVEFDEDYCPEAPEDCCDYYYEKENDL